MPYPDRLTIDSVLPAPIKGIKNESQTVLQTESDMVMTEHTQPDRGREADRRFSVSANRGAARHRIRYVEAGGASVDTEECAFCQSEPSLNWPTETVATKRTDISPGADSTKTDTQCKG